MKKLFSTSLLILAGMLLLLGSCKEDELPVSGEGNVANNELPVRLAETDYNPDNTYYLLNDNESQDVYFDSGQRSFYVSRPLQFGMDDEHCFQLRFYSPRALKNVTFWARIDGYEEEFKFMSLEKIMPFQQLRVHIPFATKDLTAYTRSGKKIRIMANPYLTEENLTFTVECDDPYWARLQSIRCKWYIAFGRYSDTQDSWKYKMKASHTREAVAIALNMAYMFSSERFKTALYEFGPLHSNNDKAGIDGQLLVQRQRHIYVVAQGDPPRSRLFVSHVSRMAVAHTVGKLVEYGFGDAFVIGIVFQITHFMHAEGGSSASTTSSSMFSSLRASPPEKRSMASVSFSSIFFSFSITSFAMALCSSSSKSSFSNDFSTYSWQRESKGRITSNEGFSVVAPIRVTTPVSTAPNRESCWDLLNRWISSMNRMGLA
jgi:hypothetical protein